MKCSLFLISLLFLNKISALTQECEQNVKKDFWICQKNEDKTFNLTYDCSLHGDEMISNYKHFKSRIFELELWSFQFPNNMKTLTIQNCDRFVLYSICALNKFSKTFEYLNVLNVTEFSLMKFKKNSSRNEHVLLKSPSVLPKNLVFQNIKSAEFSSPLISDFIGYPNECNISHNQLEIESLKFINVGMNRLDKLWHTQRNTENLKELVFQNVTVKRINNNAIELHNKNAKLEITDSNFDQIMGTFAGFTVSKVLIFKNVFKDLKTKIFEGVAEEFVFKSNKIDNIDTSIFNIHSRIVEITDNFFLRVRSSFIKGIEGIPVLLNANGEIPQKLLNISDNTFHFLTPDAFDCEDVKPKDTHFFDDLIVENNLFQCACDNSLWFSHLKASEDRNIMTKLFRYHLLEIGSNDGCLNIKNCRLNQILYNLQELCSSEYKCSNMSAFLKPNLEGGTPYLDLKNYSPDSMSEILKELHSLTDKEKVSSLKIQELSQFLGQMSIYVYVSHFLIGLALVSVLIWKFGRLPLDKISSIFRNARNFCRQKPSDMSVPCVSLDGA